MISRPSPLRLSLALQLICLTGGLAQDGTITGTVQTAAGDALYCASVQLDGLETRPARTDAGGRFRIEGIPTVPEGRRYTIRVRHNLAAEARTIEILPGATLPLDDFRLSSDNFARAGGDCVFGNVAYITRLELAGRTYVPVSDPVPNVQFRAINRAAWENLHIGSVLYVGDSLRLDELFHAKVQVDAAYGERGRVVFFPEHKTPEVNEYRDIVGSALEGSDTGVYALTREANDDLSVRIQRGKLAVTWRERPFRVYAGDRPQPLLMRGTSVLFGTSSRGDSSLVFIGSGSVEVPRSSGCPSQVLEAGDMVTLGSEPEEGGAGGCLELNRLPDLAPEVRVGLQRALQRELRLVEVAIWSRSIWKEALLFGALIAIPIIIDQFDDEAEGRVSFVIP